MRLALIPPHSLADVFANDSIEASGYYLYLPQLMDSEAYSRFVWRTCTKLSYTILDNGAFEGDLRSSTELLRIAFHVGVDEVVVPDVLGDWMATIKKVEEFQEETRQIRSDLLTKGSPLSFMGVVQGKTVHDLMACAHKLVEFPFITALGLPKHLVETVQQHVRVEMADYIRRNLPGYPVHFLGSSPFWPQEVVVAKKCGIVRGMDTSMPFVYAYQGKRIGNYGPQAAALVRPEGYFDLPASEFDMGLVIHNVRTMRSWIR